MAAKATPPTAERIAQSFKQLSETSTRLNTVSDEFSKAIAPIDAELKKLNLGVTAWHRYIGDGDENSGDFWERRIGYAKIAGKWGLALATVSGNIHYQEHEEEQWLFGDAPRAMRVEAVDHVPGLLEELVTQANKVASDLENKTQTARALALTISALASAQQGRR